MEQSATRLVLLLISVAATAAGALWVNESSSDAKGAQWWEIVLGAISGIIVGPFVVGLVVFVWQALRAPFRQRDDARKEARRLYRELHPEFPPHAVEVGMLVHGEVPDQYDASRRKRVLFLRIDYTNRGNRNVSLDFEMQWHRSFLGEHGVSLRVAHYALPTVSDILAVPLQLQPDTHARGTLTFDGEFVLGAEFDESGEVVVKEGWRADLVVTDRITGATNRTAI